MKLKSLLFIVLSIVIISACQKQLNWKIDPLTGLIVGDSSSFNTSKKFLASILAVSGSETVATRLTYDTSGKLISEYILGTSEGKDIDLYKKYYRDTTGRIERIAQLVNQPGFAKDTTFTRVYYDEPTSLNFLNAVHESIVAGKVSRDSSVFTYDGNAHLGLIKIFQSASRQAPMVLNKRLEFSYANDNLVSQKMYMDTSNSGKLSLIETTSYTFDYRLNPLIQNAEAFLTGRLAGASNNNLTRMEVVDNSSATKNYIIETSIIYNSYSLPLTSRAKFLPGEKFTTYTYYYQ